MFVDATKQHSRNHKIKHIMRPFREHKVRPPDRVTNRLEYVRQAISVDRQPRQTPIDRTLGLECCSDSYPAVILSQETPNINPICHTICLANKTETTTSYRINYIVRTRYLIWRTVLHTKFTLAVRANPEPTRKRLV